MDFDSGQSENKHKNETRTFGGQVCTDVLSRTKTFVRGFVLNLLQVSFEMTKIKRNS